jgi:hypothetical protein
MAFIVKTRSTLMAFVKINETHWNLNSIARVGKTNEPTKLGWPSWVTGIVTLASGKEFGLSREDYDALVSILEGDET